ncbi:AraC family transcriptional regulator [Pedomonas mirosovicensis]|uniref:AraC family transcriptional regulator n=1 Tax=Pedomonas mirosovicensis TaxID=2908641 RepID=UPI0021691E48|nr:AraC family transcriptional regulator [Pedomonas mirosovicensis]MCH8686103.1 AraC family transcriptional regulator [Pedomonas mirosovicensis]
MPRQPISQSGPDTAQFHRPAFLNGLEAVTVAYRRRDFPVHSHDEYVVGVVVEGAEELLVRGERHIVAAGHTLLLQPGEAHANACVGDGVLRYRVLYIPASCNPALADRPMSFPAPVSRSAALYRGILDVHRSLQRETGRLEQESLLDRLIGILRFGTEDAAKGALPRCSGRIGRTKAFIDRHFAEDFGLDDLAAIAGLSPYHLLRTFKAEVGLTPVAYRLLRRVLNARELLQSTMPIAEVAVASGFADQSHLTRSFQRLMGVSPARYRQQ